MGAGVAVGGHRVAVAGTRVRDGVTDAVGGAGVAVAVAVGEAVGRGVSVGTGVATTGITITNCVGGGGGVSAAPWQPARNRNDKSERRTIGVVTPPSILWAAIVGK